jgi:dinuclear metal center YbgI/SA1388 family protein
MNNVERAAGLPLSIADVLCFLHNLAPLELAETWDNVGLLWGDDTQPVSRVMTCLSLTPDVAGEAVRRQVELIVTHHPILFRPVQKVTSETSEGRMLLTLARNGIAVYSAHTAYDSAHDGVNRQLAESLELQSIVPLRPLAIDVDRQKASPVESAGGGRMGNLKSPRSLKELTAHVKSRLNIPSIDFVGDPNLRVTRIAVACGSAAEFIDDAVKSDCQLLLTGEARFHACLEARDRGLALVLIGHFASERPAMLQLAEQIRGQFPSLDVWASVVESDPLQRD